MRKTVILARVSSKEQEEGHSLDAQVGNLQSYAHRKSLKVIKVFKIIESSTKKTRPEFDAMIEFIKGQKEKIALVVDTVDRLQRGFREKPILDDLIQQDILELHFVKEGNILSKDANSSQKLMWNMGVVMAQSYTDQLSDNVKRSIKHKTQNGEWNGVAPIGYLNVKDQNTGRSTVIVDKERAFLIKKAFVEYSTGSISITELHKKVTQWGLRTKKGRPVALPSFHKTFQNPFYYGVMKVKGQLYRHNYPPIIDKALFDTCERIRTGIPGNKAPRQTKEEYILRGLVKCGVSGRKATCDKKKGRYVYLICRDPKNPDKKIHVKEELILEQVEKVFRSLKIHPDALENIVDYVRQTHESQVVYHKTAVQRLHQESVSIDDKLERLLDAFLDGKGITQDIYNKKHQELRQRQQDIGKELEQHHSGNDQFKTALVTLIALASKASQLFESSNFEEKRKLIGFVFSNLEIKGSTLCYSLKKPFDLFVDLGVNKEWCTRRDSNS